MLEADGVSPHTAHTTNPVPLVLTNGAEQLREGGELSDLAPTVLALLGARAARRDDRKIAPRQPLNPAILRRLGAPTA